MKIIYVGPLNFGGTCLQRISSLIELGYHVDSIDTFLYSFKKRLLIKAFNIFNINIDLLKTNKKIISLISKAKYDLLWIDKGLIVKAKTLNSVKNILPQIKIISYSPDDMMNPQNQSKKYLKCIPLYDYHITTKTYNVGELKSLGAKKILFTSNAYDPDIHKPMKLNRQDSKKYSSDVGFIGQYEKDRYQKLLFLAQNNMKVNVKGPGWEKYKNIHPNLVIQPGWVLGDEYAKYISNTKINLCFLRKVNRDLQTTRSIEIPACGGFMLAERTEEHQDLFEEGKEAEFFGNSDELLDKIKYYLINNDKREKIVKAGRLRCIESGYSNNESLKKIMDIIDKNE